VNLPSLFRTAGFGVGILLARMAWGAPEDSAHAHTIKDFEQWFPCAVSLGPQAGAQLSWMRASGEYRSLLAPVPAQEGPWVSASLGAAVSVRWRSGFNLSLSARQQAYGLQTGEDTVSFAGNPYPHTLSARTEIAYNVWPLLAGFDWMRGRQRFGIQAGVYTAFLSDSRLEWIVDGERSARRPESVPRESISGWLAAADYVYPWGPGDWILGLEYQGPFDSAFDGLKGTVRTQALQLRLGYAWALWQRRP
jgi:hypothetical protein